MSSVCVRAGGRAPPSAAVRSPFHVDATLPPPLFSHNARAPLLHRAPPRSAWFANLPANTSEEQVRAVAAAAGQIVGVEMGRRGL